jgi:hypothetical protein
MQMEEGTNDKVNAKVVDRVSLSVIGQKPHFTYMVIGWGLNGGAIGTVFVGGDY